MNTERFEQVFKLSIQFMHDVNVKQFGSQLANFMLPGMEQLKPVFKVVYEKGVSDAIPEGYMVVPVEPTGAMVKAGSWNRAAATISDNDVVMIYKAMLDTAKEAKADTEEL